jgi:spore coat polysaccharide biosynthesis predicted glycosyltransferase SpsG
VMRQITLGAALKSLGLNPVLFCFSLPEALAVRAQEFEITVLKREHWCDSPELSREVLLTDCAIAVFDGYEFTEETIGNVFNNNVRVVLIDDNGDMANFPCHLILNQNLHADSAMYVNNKSTPQLLLGLSWALIRPEVVAQINTVSISEKSGIFLSIGGTDHLGITPALREGISQTFKEEVTATTGVLTGTTLTPLDMALTMAKARVGIIACGTATWEAVCLKLPFVGIVTADNQVGIGESLVQQGIAQTVDCRSHIDIAKILDEIQLLLTRDSFDSKESALLIDGGGALRSAEQIYSLIY